MAGRRGAAKMRGGVAEGAPDFAAPDVHGLQLGRLSVARGECNVLHARVHVVLRLAKNGEMREVPRAGVRVAHALRLLAAGEKRVSAVCLAHLNEFPAVHFAVFELDGHNVALGIVQQLDGYADACHSGRREGGQRGV